jgi:hypothetical protein
VGKGTHRVATIRTWVDPKDGRFRTYTVFDPETEQEKRLLRAVFVRSVEKDTIDMIIGAANLLVAEFGPTRTSVQGAIDAVIDIMMQDYHEINNIVTDKLIGSREEFDAYIDGLREKQHAKPHMRTGPKGPRIPPDFREKYIEAYRRTCILGGYDDGRIPPEKHVADYYGADPRTVKKWREDPTINLPYPPE